MIGLLANLAPGMPASGIFNARQVCFVPERPPRGTGYVVHETGWAAGGAGSPHDRDALLWIRTCDPVTLQQWASPWRLTP